MVRLVSSMVIGLDKYIANQSDPIGRPEAIRRILADYLSRRGLLAKK